jgi:fibronectin-binding autotransporter adhesin
MPTWVQTSNGNWSTAANWSGGVPNAANALAVIPNIPGTSHYISFRNETVTVGVISVTDQSVSGYSFSGLQSFLGFHSTLVMKVTSGVAAFTIGTAPGLGSYIGDGMTLRLDSDTNISTNGATSNFTVDADVSGVGRLNKYGAGTVTLSNSQNSWSGGTYVREGILRAGDVNVFGSGGVNVASGATLFLQGKSQAISGLANGGTVNFGIEFAASYAGPIELSVTTATSSGGSGTFVGTSATDRLSVTLAPGGTSINFNGSTFTNWTTGVDTVTLTGNSIANDLYGTPVNDVISGGDGNDFISGRGGADVMDGGNGVDTLLARIMHQEQQSAA